MIPTIPTWRKFTNTEGVDYESLSYEEYCTGEGYQQRARDFFESTLGVSIKSDLSRWLGVGGLLRGAEGIDSIDNFVQSSRTSGSEAVGFVLCGVVELGGVVYVLIILICLTIAFPMLQIVNFVVGITVDVVLILQTAAQQENRDMVRAGVESARAASQAPPVAAAVRVAGQESKPAAPAPPTVFRRSGGSTSLGETPAPPATAPPPALKRAGGSDALAALEAPTPPTVLRRSAGRTVVDSTNPFDASAPQGVFARLANRLTRAPPRAAYGEVSSNSDDEDTTGKSVETV